MDGREPRWLQRARQDIGLREIPGKQHAPTIVRWLTELGAWWRDDETPWCGVAVAAWMRDCGLPIPKHWYRAKDWLNWGAPLDYAIPGCVVVFGRNGGGHVGLCVGQTADLPPRLLILGGNQGNEVNVRAFPRERVIGYRWPIGEPLPAPRHWALATGIAQATTGEA
jgi:uncharacterized protein (TIGR02594 family)